MKQAIINVFKGLTPQYYFRQLFFGILLFAFFAIPFIRSVELDAKAYSILIYGVVNTILYPYSRFAYERVVSFIMGENIFFVNAFLMLFVKFMTMFACWWFAIFITPIGLFLIYMHQKKSQK